MNEPRGIIPTAVYDSGQACAVLQIGQSKLQQLVADGRLRRLTYSNRSRFFGEELTRFCRAASGLPDLDYTEPIVLEEKP